MKLTIHATAVVSLAVLSSAALVSFFLVAHAASVSEIAYPVAELGNCKSASECHTYCEQRDNPEVLRSCLAFAKEHNLLPADVIARGEKFTDIAIKGGPGSCKNEKTCVAYCENTAHIQECTSFAERYDLLPADQLAEAKKVAAALQAGAKLPGGCTGKESCQTYCKDTAHSDECLAFAERAQLIPPEELAAARKFLPLIRDGKTPGKCASKDACENYCAAAKNIDECLLFAEQANVMSKEDLELAKKVAPFIKQGKTPGGCRSKEACETYCQNDAHTNECVDFAVAAGFMRKEDADIVKKAGGKGPGSCTSREACDNYCKSEDHINECVDFAVRAGLISKEDADQAKKFKILSGPNGCQSKAECDNFCAVPENQEICFNFAKEHGMISEKDLRDVEEQRTQHAANLSQADPTWLACIERELGPGAFGRFKTGTLARSEFPALETSQKKCGGNSDTRKQIEECLNKATCSEFNSCFDALQKGQNQQRSSAENKPDELGQKIKARALACQQEKIDRCIVLSCAEFDTCIKSLQQGSGEQSGQQQGSESPKITAKVQACQDEKINACLPKPCNEFFACLNSLGAGSGGQQQQGSSNTAMNAKIQSCIPKNGGGASGGGRQSSPDQSDACRARCQTGYNNCSANLRVDDWIPRQMCADNYTGCLEQCRPFGS